MADQKHICGVCSNEFDTVEAYLAHTCGGTGFKPTEPEHQGEDFSLIQDAALRRGAAKAEGDDKVRTETAIEELGVTPPEPQ